MSVREVCNATLTAGGFEPVTKFACLHHGGEWSDSEVKLFAIGMAVVPRSFTNYGALATKQRRMAILQGTKGRKCLFVISVPREPNDSRSTEGFLSRVLGLRKLFARMFSHSIGPIQCSCSSDHEQYEQRCCRPPRVPWRKD